MDESRKNYHEVQIKKQYNRGDYSADREVNNYNNMSSFDKLHNKRIDWQTPVAMT